MNTLYKKNILKLTDLSQKEIYYILHLSKKLKQEKKNNIEIKRLLGKNIILIFAKNSTRTRCSFEVACFDQGANVTCLNKTDSHIGYKETIQDTAKILSNLYDGIQYRGIQKDIEILAKSSKIPVWNGLTEQFHPTQILADLLTIQENISDNHNIDQITISYIGDIYNNIAMSLVEAASIIGFKLYLITAKPLFISDDTLLFNQLIKKHNNIILTDNMILGVTNTDFIYTDVWLSMGESSTLWEYKIKYLYKYQVNNNLLLNSKNNNIKVMHCLPSFHDYNHYKSIIKNNIISKFNLFYGLEITNDVFLSKYSIIFQQAANRIHVIKALMILTLIKNNIL
ncbi:ornithine carbamoyltransferase [Enterobacteriaceae endosymbiont of Neohaemonia nigricornis]|uniref:ornithine carbamoyltransferase n=1 Tax=Enterobacteriaceae endosymbiont of Neohaemonia nigricornis TaxID=2675792 RepID=UPI001448F5CB|nr:ornithine carbamoyltransferase [Enterobacteriaceae endosymbiont of Neohaemonia nigricornis]QJC30352.1 ornithine carbamoyltransferase [Enterobacteriaceae endosymbiont of Neohaemonia nigricornis]